MDNFDKAASKVGISDTQKQTKTYQDLKNAVLSSPGDFLPDGQEDLLRISKLADWLHELAQASIDTVYISDKELKEAVAAYGNMLRATKNVFGEENMTEAVIVAAIQAASYTAYRNVMGPKTGR